jgi:REP element-mobilizing transposase RayT
MAAFFLPSHRMSSSEPDEEAVIALINLGVRKPGGVFHGDRFACELVAESVRFLHGPRWRVLAYCLMPDHVRILILSRNGSHLEFVRLLKGRTATGLRKLGYRRVWGKDNWNRQIRQEEDLADSIAHLLASRVRARIAWNWPTYPWCGSVEWPEIDEWFLGIRQGDQRFRETLVNGAASSEPP